MKTIPTFASTHFENKPNPFFFLDLIKPIPTMALIPNENNYIFFNILTIRKFNFNIGFRPMRKQVSISIVSIPPETSPTLVFAHCEKTQIQWFLHSQKQV
jgi:hypothetical protein